MGNEFEHFQQLVTKRLLAALLHTDFVLAGAGAMKAHGLIVRPTYDIDLFTRPNEDRDAVREAANRAIEILTADGYGVQVVRSSESFVRLQLEADNCQLEIDFAVNWRADPPAQLSVGPVLSERDAVAGKLSAVYSRGEIRDFLDLDAIRMSGRYSDDVLLALGREHDNGFDPLLFAQQLARVSRLNPDMAKQYGFETSEFSEMQRRTMTWAIALRDTHGNTDQYRRPFQDLGDLPRYPDPPRI